MATSTANTASAPKRYRGEEHFVDGYVPQSMNAEYSSLHRSMTWIGMGLWLASLAAWGAFIFGLATMGMDSNAAHEAGVVAYNEAAPTMGGQNPSADPGSFNPSLFLWGGLITAIVMDVIGLFLIIAGRKQYLAYRKEYGTHH